MVDKRELGMVQVSVWVPADYRAAILDSAADLTYKHLTALVGERNRRAVYELSRRVSSGYVAPKPYEKFVGEYPRALSGGVIYNQVKDYYSRYYDAILAYNKIVNDGYNKRRLTGKRDDVSWREILAAAYLKRYEARRHHEQARWVIEADLNAVETSNRLMQQQEFERYGD